MNEGFLVINADDLGLSPEINAGILTGLRQGMITDTSLLVCSGYAGNAVAGLKDIGIEQAGIHINLDELFGWKPGGIELHPRKVLMEMLADRRFLEACAMEARRQIELFFHFKLMPTHLDTHHHVHGFFPVFEILLPLMHEFAIPAIRFSRQGYHLPTRPRIPYDKETFSHMENMLSENDLVFCNCYLENARNLLRVQNDLTELVVHPAIAGDVWRSEEMGFLLSGEGMERLNPHFAIAIG